MNLTPRLSAVADLAGKSLSLADIGTDHAYIPIYLMQKGLISTAVAADINEGPLERADKNIRKAGLSDKITLRLSDGLDNIKDNEAETVVIAGMGGEIISHMLEKPKPLGIKKMVLQPMTDIPLVRRKLHENGMIITAERLAAEKDKIYTVIACEYGTGQVFSDEDYIVSPFIKDDPIFAEYINKQLGICKTNLEKTKNAEDKSFSAQFEYLISIYEKFI
ncbi:MAG: SAM-dependent methyltransferase [Clostridia bacterium]|nr:SAM-dependent methyltransferase [Clostridia bacterium]